jgi:hypothetical protein
MKFNFKIVFIILLLFAIKLIDAKNSNEKIVIVIEREIQDLINKYIILRKILIH